MRFDDDDTRPRIITEMRVDVEAIPCDLSISGAGILRSGIASIASLDAKERAELIKAVNAGEHVEIEMTARTYRQLDGKPNRKRMRFSTDRLSRIAKTGKSTPFLVDHAQFLQTARMGTVIASGAVGPDEDPGLAAGEIAFRQRILVVKPRGVVSVLDGTMDRFSIGWRPTGKILCSAHGGVARRDCACWLGDEVEIDGVKKIVEYEFTDAELVEVSAVNVPAVLGTKIDEVRAALAAEIDHHNSRSKVIMSMPKLAAVLGLAATATDAEILAAVESRDATAAAQLQIATQRATNAEAALEPLRAQLAAANKAAGASAIDAAISTAYTEGKLIRHTDADGKALADPFEPSLRELGNLGGAAALAATLATLPVRAPISLPALGGPGKSGAPSPGPAPSLAVEPLTAAAAKQLGLTEDDIRQYGGK